MLPYADLKILRQFASLTGVTDIVPTHSGVQGVLLHEGTSCDVSLVVLETGAIEMRALSGPNAGQSGEVASMSELRAGLSTTSTRAA